jgi:DNA modification methylase
MSTAADPAGQIIPGDAEHTLGSLPAGCVDLVFTSPPYFNARPEYSEFATYGDYLGKMRRVVDQCHRLLGEGRFLVVNSAPVLVARASRGASSTRLAIPFDLHRVISDAGFDFIDDIIWAKPEGAGWATSRGRRFAADRNAMQYKTVPVTEYVLVYRKQTERLIDWNIRNHPDQEAVKASKIADGYERTNIWRIPPCSSPSHPAVFPLELADRVVRYYSFRGDVVLDPFAGSGTVGEACVRAGRRFVLAEMNPNYVERLRRRFNAVPQTLIPL